jgi:hypothetical protein
MSAKCSREGLAMQKKQTISADKLSAEIMKEIRKHPECSGVHGVAISRPPQLAPPHPNWRFAFVMDGPRTKPLIADEIARRFLAEYDLV